MAGPWEKYAQPAEEAGPWSKYVPAEEAKPQTSYKGRVLPLTREGNQVRWDWQAGITGPLVRAFTLPQEVYQGKVDPMSDEGIARAIEMGAVVTPTSPATRAGAEAVPGVRSVPQQVKQVPPAPTQEQLKAAATAGYSQMREMGVDYAPEAIAALSGKVGTDLAGKGFTDRTAPNTLAVLRDLANGPKAAPGESVVLPLNGLDVARRELGQIAGGQGSDAAAAVMAQKAIDGFIQKPPAEAVLAGPAAAAGRVLGDARSNYAAAMRSEDLAGIGDAAGLRAAAANSGQNLGNSVRSRVASALIGDKVKGYTAEELEAARAIVEGTRAQNATRAIGNLLGGGGGLGAGVTGGMGAAAGAAVGGVPGAFVGGIAGPAIGKASKTASNRMTEKALMALDEATRKRSALFEQLLADAPMVAGKDPEKRTALIRLLLMSRSPVGQYETGGGF